MEQLLRTTDVGKIYVLIRGKRGQTAKERLRKLLQSGLFHLVREDVNLLKKASWPRKPVASEGSVIACEHVQITGCGEQQNIKRESGVVVCTLAPDSVKASVVSVKTTSS